MDVARVADYLAENPVFACLAGTDRAALAARMRPRNSMIAPFAQVLWRRT